MSVLTYPSDILYPSTTRFPSLSDLGGGGGPLVDDAGLAVVINGLSTTGVDENGVLWATFSPLVGWDGSPASSKDQTAKPYQPGAWPGPGDVGPRTLAFSGLVQAPDPDTLQVAIDALNEAVAVGDFLTTVARGSQTRTTICRRQDEVLWADVTDTVAQWSAQMTCDEPRKFDTAMVGTTGLPSYSGGLVVPLVVPLVMASTVVSGQVSMTNPGNATGPVVIRIDGPIVGPVIKHVGSGLQVVFASTLSLAAGEFLVVDMEARTALAQGEVSRNGTITSRGWSGFEKGGNTWQFDSTSYNPSARVTVTATPAWL